MADRRRRVKSDDDSEGSLSGSENEVEDKNEIDNTLVETPEKLVRRRRNTFSTDESEGLEFSDADSHLEEEASFVSFSPGDTLGKVAEGSEYESAEEHEEKVIIDDVKVEPSPPKEDQQSLSEVVDEEGGEEGIADAEDVDGDFLSGDLNEDASGDSADEEDVEEERQQGDGEECSPDDAAEKELDFDEDRRNPQYIPKKGIFYEHDDRNNEESKEKEEEPASRDRKKKLWLDEGKWGHDRFREEEQFPKSRNELIDTYGYDIRNEDGPPRARRRRRYGRGPSKYDRNWEDGSAYGREKFKSPPRGVSRGRRSMGGRFRGGPRGRGRGRNHYDEDDNQEERINDVENDEVPEKIENEESEDKSLPIINSSEFPSLPTKEVQQAPPPLSETPPEQPYFNKTASPPLTPLESKSVRTLTFENSNYSNKNQAERDSSYGNKNQAERDSNYGNKNQAERDSNYSNKNQADRDSNYSNKNQMERDSNYGNKNPIERDAPPRRGKTPPFASNHDRGNRRGSNRGGPRGYGRGETNRRGRGNMRQVSPRFLENKVNSLSNDMEQLNMDSEEVDSEAVPMSESNGMLTSNSQPMSLKGAGDSSGRPKRYSSLRQRSLPETNSYQTPPPSAVPPPHPTYYETGYSTTMYAPTDTCVPTPSTQSQTVTSTPIMNPSYQTFTPPPYTDSYGLRLPVAPAPRLFPQVTAQPMLAPPPCITPAPNMMSFAPPPPPAGYQFAYQQYTPPPPPPPPAPPSDMYQTGITYYYPQSQAPPVRPTVQKRPKAAIPILPPPDREGKRNDSKDSSQTNRNFSENSNDSGSVEVTIRTDSNSQTVGVES